MVAGLPIAPAGTVTLVPSPKLHVSSTTSVGSPEMLASNDTSPGAHPSVVSKPVNCGQAPPLEHPGTATLSLGLRSSQLVFATLKVMTAGAGGTWAYA